MRYQLQQLFFLAALLCMSGVAVSQEQPSLRDRADELYRKYEYANAAALYTRLADSRRPRLLDLERLADCYAQMKDYEAAENWYARVVAMEGSEAENLLRYGEVLKMNTKYAEAKKQLEAYAAKTGDRSRVSVQLAGCDSALVWMAAPTVHRLRNEGVNTSLSEFSVFPVGDKAYYAGEPDGQMRGVGTYGWTGNSFLRVYTADRGADNGLSDAVIAVEDINNTPYHMGPVAASADGTTLYVTRTYPGKKGAVTREERQKYRTHKLELYIYTQGEGGSWKATPFPYNNVEEYSVGHAALSVDGGILYFVSDMPGGQGGTDIWYSERQGDGSWGTPVNAGATVNSAGDELFPNVGPDGTLYYSSDGFAGMGGLDIFRSTGSRAGWTRPVNLRFPVNSPGDDFAYITTYEGEEGLAGYLSSNRKGGRGSDDIYSFTFEKPKIIIILKGTASDKNTNDRLADVSVTLYDGMREIVARKRTDGSGTFEFVLDRDKSYTVLGQKEKYHGDSAKVTTVGITESDTLEVTLLLEPVFEVGKTFELENIYYDFDKHNIRPDAAAVLDELVRTLRDNPTLRIELSSHTDSRGSDAYNLALSQRRAQSAVDYLVSRGIARDRMVARGYGETRLVNDCGNGVPCTREQHQANRRTEVTVLAY
ncbi:OmpA family protein [Parapedobacter indicus]|uniref:WD40-like Beta Propeller Repeat n=1 Tax=Parapedobacter indicus TaxID=1477437 RepID=A0A1I3CQ43_9SPHI|nr:OmpA family protein [Parapedobacter indicus]PPL04350.1 WD40 repeat protein [Parapedobacter indicus]SFH76642.1 WD40-like Beta Propeller Repeat [Parapedobacter indicus]